MELSKNIFFNTDKLIQNTEIKISYSGLLYEKNAKEVFVHYGFNEEWNNVSEIKMEKTDLGYQAILFLPEYNTLNLCFRDGDNNWDNNNTLNYIFNIEKPEISLIVKEECNLITKPRLRKSYILSKKIRLALYKLIIYVPKLISGNYKRKLTGNA